MAALTPFKVRLRYSENGAIGFKTCLFIHSNLAPFSRWCKANKYFQFKKIIYRLRDPANLANAWPNLWPNSLNFNPRAD
jgi:hypothetical protein